jgi:hypothetical protein
MQITYMHLIQAVIEETMIQTVDFTDQINKVNLGIVDQHSMADLYMKKAAM